MIIPLPPLAIFLSAFFAAATASHLSAVVQRWLCPSLLGRITDYNDYTLIYTAWRESKKLYEE
jgi:hypothetical protein